MRKRGLEKFSNLVEALGTLPTVGKKSAVRFAYHMVLQDAFSALKLAHAIEDAVANIRRCSRCGGLSEDEICDICLDEDRDGSKLCIVESAKDIFIIEENAGYEGRYFVLESLEEEQIERLKKAVEEGGVSEIIFALTPSLANDGIILYVEEQLVSFALRFTKIAQGVPTGVHLENVDTLSLSKALSDRVEI
ncbi:MAG: recombination protein RecR [Campylobacteraceae bacterium 4484_4]|nr:MAG: recombination protein RecR [Campylobacteraceae bacterium 4484_4]